MTCKRYSDRWTDYLFRELPEETIGEMREHLEGCAACRAEVEALESAVGAVREGLRLPAVSEDFVRDTVRKARARESERRRVPFLLWAPAAAAVVLGLFLYGMFHLEFADTRSKIAQQVEEKNGGLRDEALAPMAPGGAKATGDRQQATEDREQATGQGQQVGAGREPFLEDDKALGGVAVPTADAEMARRRADAGAVDHLQKEGESIVGAAPMRHGAPAPDAPVQPEARRNEVSAESSAARSVKDAGAPSAVEGRAFEEKIVVTGMAPVVESTATAAGVLQAGERGLGESKKEAGTGAGEKQKRQKPAEEALAPVPAAPRPAGPSGVGGSVPPNGAVYPDIFFEHAGVNPFIETEEDRFSTFAVDVDTASYGLVRNYLDRGVMPPKDAARVEEFVNAFDQGYPPETRKDFAVRFDGMPSPFGPGYHLLRIGVVARSAAEEERKPLRLTFVIDCSGSMAQENRLDLVKRGLGMLVDRLDGRDTVAIAVFRTEGYRHLEPTSGADREAILGAVRSLYPNGSTNVGRGLAIGYRMASEIFDPRAVNRVILLSDGVANEGITAADFILDTVRTDAARGVFLTTVGVGLGNYNDALLERLADAGNGMYFYVDDDAEAERFFLQDLAGMLATVAKDVKIQVEFDPKAVARYRLLGYENRDVADRDFRNDAVDAGEVNSGHTVTALYEVKLTGKKGDLGTVRLRYKQPLGDKAAELAFALVPKAVAPSFEKALPHLRRDALVAEFAELLRGSYWAKDGSFEAILRRAEALPPAMRSAPETEEFLDLVRTAARLRPAPPPDRRPVGP
jgi:Ca-activated chloride channel family protein